MAALTQGAEESYPAKPIRIVVPWPAGSVSDSISRLVAERAAPHLGVPIVVENKPGASGVIGADYVAKSKPEGYVVLHGNSSQVAVVPAAGGKLPFDPVNDLAPVTLIGRGEMVLVTPASLNINALAELVAFAKSSPNGLTYGTTGMGIFSELEIVTWGGYFVVAGTPSKVVERLNAALLRALSESEVRMKFKSWGLEADPSSPQTFATFLAEERTRWVKRVKLTGIRLSD